MLLPWLCCICGFTLCTLWILGGCLTVWITTLPGKYWAWFGLVVELLTRADNGICVCVMLPVWFLPSGLPFFWRPAFSFRFLELPNGISPIASLGICAMAVPGFYRSGPANDLLFGTLLNPEINELLALSLLSWGFEILETFMNHPAWLLFSLYSF